MKLTPHEKKILSLIENDPDIINDTKKRAKIAKDNGLSEKTLRNRIGDLKKYGVISIGRTKNQSADKKIIEPDIIIRINPYLTAVKYDSCTLKKFLAPKFCPIIEIIAVFKPKTGKRRICSKRAAEPKPATAYSPNIPIYVRIIKFPTEINSKAADIGAD